MFDPPNDKSYKVANVLHKLHSPVGLDELRPPSYQGSSTSGVVLGVASMKHHMTDEGWQIQQGLYEAGYELCGFELPTNSVDIPHILKFLKPGIVVIQDKREWDVQAGDFREARARFNRCEALAIRPDVFRMTIFKDTHQRPSYHHAAANEIGCHAWIVYYHPDIVKHLSGFTRRQHMVRTYHSLDPKCVPPYHNRRTGCIISGALSSHYPLRQRLVKKSLHLPETTVVRHPGYHRKGCTTPRYLRQLCGYKVAICTASIYGYALRKIIESTAAGCVVITDLPSDEVLPEIDNNLVRVHPDIQTRQVTDIVRYCLAKYDPERQREYAQRATTWYNYRAIGQRLAADIELMRVTYNDRK